MKKFLAFGTVLAATLALTACASGTSGAPAEGDGESIIIGSANFSESQLLATIYSVALKSEGVSVTEKFNIGNREVYVAALEDGSIDLVPEYIGSLVKYYDPEATASTIEDMLDVVTPTLPDGFELLDVSGAQDNDTLAVTRETADKYDLTSIADLEPVAGKLTLGAASYFAERVKGLVGLQDQYGLEFKEFLPLDSGGPLTMTALVNGQVQVANIFSTDPLIVTNDLVVLEDPKVVFTPDNVVPLIRTGLASPTIVAVINNISAEMTTDDLIALNARAAKGEALSTIATDWLTGAGII